MNIRVDMNTPITDGSEVVFRSPVDCSQITGLIVYFGDNSKEFAFADAHGNNVGDIDHLFAENAVVKVILDVTHAMAYVQNADTNAYIERTFVKSINGSKPDENGNVDVSGIAGGSPVYLVTISDTDKAQQTYADIMAAYQAGYVLQCDYRGFLLPLKSILDGEFIFSGTIGITSFHIYVRTNGQAIVNQQTLAQKKEIPTKTSELENDSGFVSEGDLPVGGGNVFEITETCPEAVKEFAFELPVNWGRIKIANIHINFGKIETAFQLYGKLGGATQSLRDVSIGSEVGVNMFFVKAFETASQVSFGAGFTIGTASHGSARPALGSTGSAKAGRNSNALTLYSSTDGVLLPEGTTIQVWGVYEQ